MGFPIDLLMISVAFYETSGITAKLRKFFRNEQGFFEKLFTDTFFYATAPGGSQPLFIPDITFYFVVTVKTRNLAL